MQYTFEDFQACLNQPFELSDHEHQETLTLVQADTLPNAATTEGRTAFSILFQSDKHQALPQSQYRLSNAQLGELELFIVPVAEDDNGIRYEAIFS